MQRFPAATEDPILVFDAFGPIGFVMNLRQVKWRKLNIKLPLWRELTQRKRLPRWRHLARMIDKSSKRMGAARFGHRTPGTVPGLPHPPSSRAPRGGANEETQAPTWRRHPSFDPSFDRQPRDDREGAPRGLGASDGRHAKRAAPARPARRVGRRATAAIPATRPVLRRALGAPDRRAYRGLSAAAERLATARVHRRGAKAHLGGNSSSFGASSRSHQAGCE